MLNNLDQQPFVDVFKRFKFFDTFSKKGKVKSIFDKNIGRKIFDLKGKISAANFLDIENPKKNFSSLGLNGRYLYISFQCINQKQFFIHLDYKVDQHDKVFIHVSNLYKNFEQKFQDIYIPYKGHQNKWSLLVIDVYSLLIQFNIQSIKNEKNLLELIKIKFCSTMKVKGVYTSDILYNQDNIPNEINFIINSTKTWNETYNMFLIQNKKMEQIEKQKKIFKQNLEEKANQELLQQLKMIKQKEQKENKIQQKKEKEKTEKKIQNNFVINLKRVVGFTGKTCPDIRFVMYQDKSYIALASDEVNDQVYLEGHQELISCIEYHQQTQTLISCSGQQNCQIFLHDLSQKKIKIKKLNQELQEVRLVSIDPKRQYLALVGQNKLSKDCILIYQINPMPQLISKHISDFNILCLKFSPIDSLKLISCGKENIKFWRIKNDHMNGSSVVLNNYARQSIFTVFDFDIHEEQNNIVNNNKVIVGSNKGMIFIVNYQTRNLESVYKVHDKTIYSLSIYCGFCVTGSEDNFIRVWPLDFNEFHLETKFEDSVIATDIYFDGLQVAVGVSSGYIGLLNLSQKTCKTILRAHNNEIYQIQQSDKGNKMLTLGDDFSIRIWDKNLEQENIEFNYTEQDKCNVILFIDDDYFIGGFDSGTIRYFDISNLNVLKEIIYHRSKILSLCKDTNNRFLITGDGQGIYSVIDLQNDCNLITYLQNENFKFPKISCSISNTLNQIALIGDNNAQINFYDMSTFGLKHVQKLSKSFVHSLKFNNIYDQEILLLTSNCSLEIAKVYDKKCQFKKAITNAHSVELLDALCIAKNMYVTCDSNGCLKIWQFIQHKAYLIHQHSVYQQTIYSLEYDQVNKILYCAGGAEGIFIWEIQSELPQCETQLTCKEQMNSNQDTKEIKQGVSDDIKNENFIKEKKNQLDDSLIDYEQMSGEQIKQQSSQQDKSQELQYFEDIEKQFRYLTYSNEIKFKKMSKEKYKEYNNEKLDDEQTFNHRKDLPLCHYYNKHDKKNIQFTREKQLILNKLTGIELSSINNYIWNNLTNEIYFFLENKIVIQKIQDQTQQILHVNSSINNLQLSHDKKLLYVTSHLSSKQCKSFVFQINLENLCINEYDFQCRSIQKICVSFDDKYIGLIGTYQDSKVTIFDQVEKKIFYQYKNQETLNDCRFVYNNQTQQYRLYIVDDKNISIIKFKHKKAPQKIQIQVYQKSIDIKLTSIEVIEDQNNLLILGDTQGNIIVYKELQKKNFKSNNFIQIIQQSITDNEILFIKKLKDDCKVFVSTLKNELIKIEVNESDNDTMIQIKDIQEFNSIVLNISTDNQDEKGLCLLKNAEIFFFDFVNKTQQKYSQMTNSKNQVYQLIPVQSDQFNWLIIIFDNGQTDIYDLDTLTQQKSLVNNSTISHGLYIDVQCKLYLFSQEQEILVYDVSQQDIVLSQYYKIQSQYQQQDRFFKNYFNQSCQVKGTSFIIVSNKKGDCYILDFNEQTKSVNALELCQGACQLNVNYLEYGQKQFLAISDKKKRVKIFNHFNDGLDIKEQQFELVSQYQIDDTIKDDYIWIQTKFLQNKNLISMISNNNQYLIVYDFINDIVQNKLELLQQPTSMCLDKNLLLIACKCNLKRIKINCN